nr:MAG TPA: hypothetical protein [Caudoviricetes sp.]DAZ20838.1 MAG TPA: hypothetical protein [Caudoviricetes sp.]
MLIIKQRIISHKNVDFEARLDYPIIMFCIGRMI